MPTLELVQLWGKYLLPPLPLHSRIYSFDRLGLAYAGTNRRDIADLLTPILEESGISIELVAHAGLALGLVFAGTTDSDISQAIIQVCSVISFFLYLSYERPADTPRAR